MLCCAVVPLAPLALVAQRGGGFRGALQPPPSISNAPYDGRFTFVRLKYTNLPGGFYYRGQPSWSHGYPQSEQNLVRILREITTLHPQMATTNVIAMDDPQLFKYPVAYMTEASWWVVSDAEAAALRAYLLKGGFIIFDDFREYGSGVGWQNFTAQMKKVMPELRFVDLSPAHPIFHSFYDVNSFSIVPQYYDRGAPVFRGAYVGNDPAKRLMIMVNFNTDVSNFWEYSAMGFRPISESNEAYKLGVNYIVYALTH